MIDFKTLVQMLEGGVAALWKDWVVSLIKSGAMPALAALDMQALDPAEVEAAIDRRRQSAIARRQGAIAVVPVRGVIIPRPNIYEAYGLATSVDTIVSLTRAALQDPNVKAVVQVYNSPGGSVFGVPEGFEQLYQMRGDKPIVAVSEYLMASAAYWLASAADEIVAAPSAYTGSIGAYMLHLDFSKFLENAGVAPTYIHAGKYKVEGNSDEPLSDEARAYLQSEVDETYRQFTADVARGRGLQVSAVRGEAFGQGRVLKSAAAKAAGMIDEVRTLRDTLAAYGLNETQGPGPRALAPERRRRALALMERDSQQ